MTYGLEEVSTEAYDSWKTGDCWWWMVDYTNFYLSRKPSNDDLMSFSNIVCRFRTKQLEPPANVRVSRDYHIINLR